MPEGLTEYSHLKNTGVIEDLVEDLIQPIIEKTKIMTKTETLDLSLKSAILAVLNLLMAVFLFTRVVISNDHIKYLELLQMPLSRTNTGTIPVKSLQILEFDSSWITYWGMCNT